MHQTVYYCELIKYSVFTSWEMYATLFQSLLSLDLLLPTAGSQLATRAVNFLQGAGTSHSLLKYIADLNISHRRGKRNFHLCFFRRLKARSATKIIPLTISRNYWRVSYMYSRSYGIATCNCSLMSVIEKPYGQWAAVCLKVPHNCRDCLHMSLRFQPTDCRCYYVQLTRSH